MGVSFEMLKQFPQNVIPDIAAFFKLEWDGEIRVQDELVGYIPNDGKVGRWREFFSDEELDYFHSIVPEDYWGLWHD